MTEKEYDKAPNIISWIDKLLEIESSVCEGLLWPMVSGRKQNIFKRPVLHEKGNDLSYVSGLAYSGLRVSAFLNPEQIRDCWKQIRTSGRQNLPIVVNVNYSNSSNHRTLSDPEFLDLKTLQLVSSNSQEAIDFALIAHKASETALVPSVHQISVNDCVEISEVPRSELIKFLGNPEDWIDVPTPAQSMIFGTKRRRVPQWFNFDTPALLGAQKDQKSLARESAAHEVYIEDHLQKILTETFQEFEEITGRKYDSISAYEAEKSTYLLITAGLNSGTVEPVIDELRSKKVKIGFVNINVINPFPYRQIADLISGKKAVSVLQPGETNWLISRVHELVSHSKSMPSVITGKYHGDLSAKDLLAVGMNMTSRDPKKSFYCDVAFSSTVSKYPKYQVMLQEVERNYPELKNLGLRNEDESHQSAKEDHRHSLGLFARQYKDRGAPFTQLSRFHDYTALFYEDRTPDEIIAEPLQAISAIPAASTSLFTTAEERDSFPLISTQNCTACGSCMVQCPFSAMPSVSIGFEGLINAGIKMASDSGTQIIGLLPMVKNLAKAAAKVVSGMNEDGLPVMVDGILGPAFDNLASQMKIEDEKLEAARNEYEAIAVELRKMPVTLSDHLYHVPDSQQKGSGEIFFLAIDPNACTGCGLCVEACDEDAIEMVPETADLYLTSQEKMELWNKLPDTSSDTINRLLYDEEYDSFAALLLSRNFYYGLLGGDSQEKGLASRQMIHLISALTESLVQPRYKEFVKTLEEQIQNLADNIHSLLSESLPTENFDNIAKAIENTADSKVPFDEIVSNISKEDRLKQVDAREIKRKIELLQALQRLKWSLSDGPTGTGRARSGINMAGKGNFDWAKTYPFNPFISPIMVWDGEYSAELTHGIVDGQIRSIVDNLKLIRKAELEVKNKYIPREHDNEIAALDWNLLTEDEKNLVPPIILIVNGPTLKEDRLLNSLDNLMTLDSPIKVVLLDDLISTPQDANNQVRITSRLTSFFGLRYSYLFQGSTADSQILFDGLIHGLNSHTPALFRIYCPEPESHSSVGYSWPGLSSLALNSRAFPYLKFNPEKYEGFLSNCLSIVDNPQLDETWISEVMEYKEGEKDKSISFDVTWADWAFTLKNWESHFEEIDMEAVDTIHISDYISSETSIGTPVIYRIRDGKLTAYKVSAEVVDQTRSVKESWDLIRELSGDLTPFPEKLKKQVEKDVQKEFDTELSRIKAEYDRKLIEKEQEQVAAIRQRLRDKLIELTTKNK